MILFGLIQPMIINADNTSDVLTPGDIFWTDMTFKSSNILVNMEVKINLRSPTETSGDLSETMGLELSGSPWANKDTRCLTIETTVRRMFFFHEKYVEQTWFNATDGTAYRRIRYRKGDDPWIKIYRWIKTGVHRLKIKPKNSNERKKTPVKWTQQTRSFYPYPKDISKSVPVSDPSFLFYILSSIVPDNQKISFKLCVFGKKQLHRLTIKNETSLAIKALFKIHSLSNEVSVKSNIKSNIFSIEAEPVLPENLKPELFSLFGLEKDIRIYMDCSRGLPIRISGINNKAGKLVFDLSNVKTK